MHSRIALAAFFSLPFSLAAAPTPRAHLIYVREAGADGCPDEEQVRGAVAARLGYDPFSPQAQRTVTVVVRGEKEGQAPQLIAAIELSNATGDVDGTRQLRSPHTDCKELSSALELAIALAIDPLSVLGETSRPSDAPSETPTDPHAAPSLLDGSPPAPFAPPVEPPSPFSALPAPREKAPLSEPTRIRGGVGAILALGSAPSVAAAGFTLALGFRQQVWSVGLEVRGDLPAGASDGTGRVTTALLAASLVACLHRRVLPLRTGQMEIAGCAVFGGGVQWGIGEGYALSSQGAAPYVAGGLRVALEIPLGHRLAFEAHGDVLLPAIRAPLQVMDGNTGLLRDVYTPPFVTGAIGAALLFYFR